MPTETNIANHFINPKPLTNPEVSTDLAHWLSAQSMASVPIQVSAQALDTLFVQALNHGVLALLGHWIATQATLMHFADHRQLVRAEHARNTLLDALHRTALAELAPAFAAAGVFGLVIKGLALARSHYPNPGLRPRVDTDLFVEPTQIARAHQILLSADWQPVASNFSGVVLPERTYQKRVGGAVIHLDVHWALSSRPILARALPFNTLFADSVAFEGLSHWRMPCAVDALLVAVVHRVGHHRDQERFIWLYDVYLLWQSMNWSEKEQALLRAEKAGLCAILLDALMASRTIFHTELSSEHMARLQSAQGEPSAMLLQDTLSNFAFDWRYASWRERCALLKQRIWAEPGYLRSRFNANSAPILWLQLRRWFNAR